MQDQKKKKEREKQKNFHSQTCGIHLEFHSWFTQAGASALPAFA